MRNEQEIVREFIRRRPTMFENNRDPARMAELLQQEIDELKIEILAGDVDKIAGEIPDVLWFCITIAEVYGIDVENSFWAKAIRNDYKYDEKYFNDGLSYEEASTLCRAMWNRDNDVNFLPDNL